MLAVSTYINHFTEIWNKMPDHLPNFENQYSTALQIVREDNFTRLQEKMKQLQSKKNLKALKEKNPEQSFFPVFRSFLENVFDFKPEHLEIILSPEFKNVSKDFFQKARAFDPELSPEGIYQGIRNVWIMNGLQQIIGIPVEITPSVFAYSMIYPYSDNYLDDPLVSTEMKQTFSNRFSLRLHGHNIVPENYTEKQLYKLVDLIEKQFPRIEFSEVFESLYAIHRGQTRSLELINGNEIGVNTILEICFEKGGASVLADGYLVAGKISADQEQALFGYGIYLQLLDDIQDIKEDMDSGTKTLFSCLHRNQKLSSFVNQTIHFGQHVMDELKCFHSNEIETMLGLMNHSIETMVIESVGLNSQIFPADYIQDLEKYSPLRFDFIRKKKSESKSQRLSLFKKYFEQNFEKSYSSVKQ